MKKFKPIGFVLFEKENDRYLAPLPSDFTSSDCLVCLWTHHPQSAKIFKTRDFAIKMIKKILDERYTTESPLVLCRIFESNKKYLVESDQDYFVCEKDSEYMIEKLERRSLS